MISIKLRRIEIKRIRVYKSQNKPCINWTTGWHRFVYTSNIRTLCVVEFMELSFGLLHTFQIYKLFWNFRTVEIHLPTWNNQNKSNHRFRVYDVHRSNILEAYLATYTNSNFMYVPYSIHVNELSHFRIHLWKSKPSDFRIEKGIFCNRFGAIKKLFQISKQHLNHKLIILFRVGETVAHATISIIFNVWPSHLFRYIYILRYLIL